MIYKSLNYLLILKYRTFKIELKDNNNIKSKVLI